jgi:hypothetical protein
MLPPRCLGDLLDGGALGALEHLDHLGLLGAGARRGLLGRCSFARLGRLRRRLTVGRHRGAVALGSRRRGDVRGRGVGRRGARARCRQAGRVAGLVVLRLDADGRHAFAGDDHPLGSAGRLDDPDEPALLEAGQHLLLGTALGLDGVRKGRTERSSRWAAAARTTRAVSLR